MDASQLRALQAPLKARYRDDPATAAIVLHASATIDQPHLATRVITGHDKVTAGLHPATGGDSSLACSCDMLLEALVACAGVTLAAVATAYGIELRGGTITADGDLDFRGTLGVAREVPVGFTELRLRFDLETDATPEQVTKLIEATERYCVIYQTLRNPPPVAVDDVDREGQEGGGGAHRGAYRQRHGALLHLDVLDVAERQRGEQVLDGAEVVLGRAATAAQPCAPSSHGSARSRTVAGSGGRSRGQTRRAAPRRYLSRRSSWCAGTGSSDRTGA